MGIISGGIIGSAGVVSIILSSVLSSVLSDNWRYFDVLGTIQSIVQSNGLGYGPPMVISAALLICMLTSGLAAWRHYLIRFLLWRSHTFPWKAPQFLDDATARILLRRVGGGYSFPHHLLLDYFANLPQETP